MAEVVAFVCLHVLEDSRPILLVARDDGEWMFLCGAEHTDEAENFSVVGMNHLLQRDGRLCEVLDLPDNFEAERQSIGGDWVVRRIEEG